MEPYIHDLTKDRIERHVAAMGGPAQQCEVHPDRDATHIIDGVAYCDQDEETR